jgi:ribosome-associated toxin RatA of RatAB toxin-antitoxin module
MLVTLPVAAAVAMAAPEIADFPYGAHGRTVQAHCHVNVPPAAVYKVLTDYAGMPSFMPLVKEVVLLETGPNRAKVRFRFRYMGVFDFTEIDERTFQPPHRITFSSIEGPLKSAMGVWTLTPEGKGTRLAFRISAEPPFPLPPGVMDHLVRKASLDLLEGIRLRAESNGTWTRR